MYKALSNLACDCFILDIYSLIFCAYNAYVSEGIQTSYTIYALLCNSKNVSYERKKITLDSTCYKLVTKRTNVNHKTVGH